MSGETGCYFKGESRKSRTQELIQVFFPKDLIIDIIYNDFCKDNVSWRITSKYALSVVVIDLKTQWPLSVASNPCG